MGTNSRNFQGRLDSVLTQAKVNAAQSSLTERELLFAVLVELTDIRFEIQESHAADLGQRGAGTAK